MTQPVAWSYSRIVSMETCPRKHWHLNVQKDLKEPESDQMAEGTATHGSFRDYLKRGTALPLHLRHHEPVLAKINALPGEKSIEQQIALDVRWQPCDWFGKDAWVRVISDLTQLNGRAAICWDWKTGKPKDDFTQLRLNSAITMHLAPEIDSVRMSFYWTKSKSLTSDKMTRPELPEFWGKMLARVANYQGHFDKNDFPPLPNPFCKGCIVKTCQYWQPRK